MNSIRRWLESQFDCVDADDEIRICCPFCDGDTKHHMYVSQSKQVVHCFRCGWSGTHFELVRQVTGADSYAEVWRRIKEPLVHVKDFQAALKKAMEKQTKDSSYETLTMPDWFQAFRTMDGSMDTHSRLVLKYALKRLSPEDVNHYGVGACVDKSILNSKYMYRLIMPVEGGYFQARAIGDFDPKYVNPDEPVGNRVFNHAALYGRELVIAEGMFSAIAIGPEAIAVLGKSVSDKQKARIAKTKATKITIAFDSDAAFSKGAMEIADYLAARDRNVFVRKYESGDPDSCQEYQDHKYSPKLKIRARLGGL